MADRWESDTLPTSHTFGALGWGICIVRAVLLVVVVFGGVLIRGFTKALLVRARNAISRDANNRKFFMVDVLCGEYCY